MDINDRNHTLSRILSKELIGSISDADKAYLENWLRESKDHQDSYQRITGAGWYQSNQRVFNGFDVERAWSKVEPKITRAPKVVRLRISVFKYVAAAASLLLLLTGYLYREQLENYFGTDQVVSIITNNQIKPGTDKAILTLANGTALTLGDKDSLQLGNAKSTRKEIVYQDKGGGKGEIEYNTLTVPRGGQFGLELSDGTRVWLNSQSQVRYPTHFIKGDTRRIELVYGEIYLKVTSSKLNGGARFTVDQKRQSVEVLGTEFNIKAYPNDPVITTTLVEGRVQVSQQGNRHVLLPGQQSILTTGSGNVRIQDADVFREVSWKDGIFSFKDKSLADIMKVFSRWYDMEVQFASEDIKELTFDGTLHKDQSIEDILHFLQGTINSYEIEDKTITLK
ncbi:FecR family protein [Muricauda brasiliensis]|uniref:FecR family protein n=1 Tax=Muricauda brasiliensis TaxID=2162892 RepID=UPI000D345A2A|nr:FecR domain-containing protein [Muricauda brasiliensis]